MKKAIQLVNVKLLPNTKKDLDKLKVHPRETYEQLIRRIILEKTTIEDIQVKSPGESLHSQNLNKGGIQNDNN